MRTLVVVLAAAMFVPAAADAQRRHRRTHRSQPSHGRSSAPAGTSSGASSSGASSASESAGGAAEGGGDDEASGSSAGSAAAATSSSGSGAAGASSGAAGAANSAGAAEAPSGGSGASAASESGASGGASASAPAEPEPPPPRPTALDIAVGVRALGRAIVYNQPVSRVPQSYQLAAAPMIAAALEWYPGAHFTGGPGSWFGIVGSFDYALGLSSVRSDGTSINSSAYGFAVGGRFRVPFLVGSDGGISVSYAQRGFSVVPLSARDSSNNSIEVPDVDYRAVRVYASSRIEAGNGRLSVNLGVGTWFVFGTGEMGGSLYFPRATVTTLETNLTIGVRIIAGLELRVGADMFRVGWKMNPQPGDARIVGGALDQYYSFYGMIAYRL